jgi:hypothetical protein
MLGFNDRDHAEAKPAASFVVVLGASNWAGGPEEHPPRRLLVETPLRARRGLNLGPRHPSREHGVLRRYGCRTPDLVILGSSSAMTSRMRNHGGGDSVGRLTPIDPRESC